jgi:oxygen-independent coproporphyrinogen-3 oxidase
MSETLILGLRLVGEGVRRADFAARFGRELDEVFGEALDRVEALGLVMQTPDAVRLSERGYLLSNQVFMRLLPEEA